MTRTLLCLGSLVLFAGPSNAQTWSALGDGVHGRVAAMAEYNGELYVGGQGFFNSGAQIGIVKWNGNAFEALPGLDMFGDHSVEAMLVYAGQLFVGGVFQSASGPFGSITTGVARWDGSMWSPAGDGFDGWVNAFCIYNGELYAGGDFGTSGNTSCPKVARWDGMEWVAPNTPFANNGRIAAMEEYDGELYVAGNFYAWDSYAIARYDGTAWSDLGGDGIQLGLDVLGKYDGRLLVGIGRQFEVSGTTVNGIAAWDGASWTSLDSYDGPPFQLILTLTNYHGDLYAGGDFISMGGNPSKSIARYNGTAWNAVGSGVDSTGIIVDTLPNDPWDTLFIQAPHQVAAMLEYQGDLYVGGEFNMIGGIEAHGIAKWNLPVGIAENVEASAIRMYPNPASNALTIEVPSGSVLSGVRIFDGTGRLVLHESKPPQGPLDVGDLHPGMYRIELRIGDHWVQKSLSVVR